MFLRRLSKLRTCLGNTYSNLTMPSRNVQIMATPSVALVDDGIHVVVTGLRPSQPVTLAAMLNEEGKVYISHAVYTADDSGTVDVNKAASTGGTYTGVESTGLIWSMHPAVGQMEGLRLFKQNVELPFVFHVNVIDGYRSIRHQDDIPKADDNNYLASVSFERFYQAPDVTAIPVKDGSIRGVLFLPPGDGPFPGVIDMFGTAGGLIKFRAALLASRGFAALALPYFGYEDLPKGLSLNLEYFEEAIEWFHNHPKVNKSGIGVVGVSKGGSLALHMAAVSNKVKAVVSINPNCIQSSAMHYYHGVEQVCFNPVDDGWILEQTDEGLVFGKSYILTEQNKNAFIPIEKAENCNFLFVFGEDDPSNDYSHLGHLVNRLKSHGKSNYIALSYPGAGHLIEPPYTPHCRTSYAKLLGTTALYGGSTKPHAIAQEDSWKMLKLFLHHHLDSNSYKNNILNFSSNFSKL